MSTTKITDKDDLLKLTPDQLNGMSREDLLKQMRFHPSDYSRLNKGLKIDSEVCLTACKSAINGRVFDQANNIWINTQPIKMENIPWELKSNRDFIIDWIKLLPPKPHIRDHQLAHMPSEFYKDREIMLLVMERYPQGFGMLGLDLRSDEEIATRAITYNYQNVTLAGMLIRPDRKLSVKLACTSIGTFSTLRNTEKDIEFLEEIYEEHVKALFSIKEFASIEDQPLREIETVIRTSILPESVYLKQLLVDDTRAVKLEDQDPMVKNELEYMQEYLRDQKQPLISTQEELDLTKRVMDHIMDKVPLNSLESLDGKSNVFKEALSRKRLLTIESSLIKVNKGLSKRARKTPYKIS